MVKVKELKDDAVLEIAVNKNYYLMAKAASLAIIQSLNIEEKGEEYFKETITKKYEDLDPMQRAFYTIVLLLSEIEKTATEKNLYIEKEVLEPGDEGYVEPKID
jgi:menaquinone-dependent protoporphyrinogen IX oxidase